MRQKGLWREFEALFVNWPLRRGCRAEHFRIAVGVGLAGFVLLDEKKRRKVDDRDPAFEALFHDPEDENLGMSDDEIDELSALLATGAGSAAVMAVTADGEEPPIAASATCCAPLDSVKTPETMEYRHDRASRTSNSHGFVAMTKKKSLSRSVSARPSLRRRFSARWAWLTVAMRKSLAKRVLVDGEAVMGMAVYIDLATGLIRGLPW